MASGPTRKTKTEVSDSLTCKINSYVTCLGISIAAASLNTTYTSHYHGEQVCAQT